MKELQQRKHELKHGRQRLGPPTVPPRRIERINSTLPPFRGNFAALRRKIAGPAPISPPHVARRGASVFPRRCSVESLGGQSRGAAAARAAPGAADGMVVQVPSGTTCLVATRAASITPTSFTTLRHATA